MVKRTILIGLLLGLLTTSTGCGLLHAIFRHRCGPCGPCDQAYCDPCGPECCSSCSCDCGPCGDACCEPGCEPSCDPCGEPCCGQPCGRRCGPCGPLTWVFGILDGAFCCHNGCGEIYWGEWHSDPPDCCDPCDRCGNFTGCGGCGCGGYDCGCGGYDCGCGGYDCGCGGGGYSYGGGCNCSGGNGYGEMARMSDGNSQMMAGSSARRTAGTNPRLPNGAKMISQSDRMVGPARAPSQRQVRKSAPRQARSPEPDDLHY